MKDHLAGAGHDGPQRHRPVVPVEWKVTEIEWIRQFREDPPDQRDDAFRVDEKPVRIERLPAAKPLWFELGHPQPTGRHGALGG